MMKKATVGLPKSDWQVAALAWEQMLGPGVQLLEW